MRRTAFVLITLFFLFGIFSPVYSQSVDDLESELDKKSEEIKNNQETLSKLQKEIDAIRSSTVSIEEKIVLVERQIKSVEEYINAVKKGIKARESAIDNKGKIIDLKESQVSTISSQIYKLTRLGIIEYFFLNNSGESIFKNFFYRRYLVSDYLDDFKNKQQELAELLSEKKQLEEDKKELTAQSKQLDKMKTDLALERSSLQGQISYKSTQSSQIKSKITLLKDQISDLQVAILVAKSGSTTGVGSVPSSGDFDASFAGFTQKAPSGYFGVFSFGAYTHRMGMSQYGAQARAVIGKQTSTQILQAYYGKAPVYRNTSGTIKVEGYGSMDFETKYMYGIAEMPSDWDLEALKAQAVATRTYAYTNYYNKTPICITQSCQVWSLSKYNNVMAGQAPKWKQAVDQTKGMIISGVVTYYSATSGGYLTTSGWDTTDKKGGSGAWTTNAWESKANSPWFYRAWYRQTYNDASATCNRKPWMSQEEMSDILNAYLVVKGIDVKGSVNTSKIVPVTLPYCQMSGLSGSPYSMAEMRGLLSSPVTSISGSPVVTNNNSGTTTEVSFITNRGVVKMTGADFKQIFNMRAPGYLSIPQNNYVFINVVRK